MQKISRNHNILRLNLIYFKITINFLVNFYNFFNLINFMIKLREDVYLAVKSDEKIKNAVFFWL